MGYEHSKKYLDKYAMDEYLATKADVGRKYGNIVRAVSISNREYQHRFDRLNESRVMKAPPSSGRIFPGYLVIRNFETDKEYETWIPDDGFEEVYEKKSI